MADFDADVPPVTPGVTVNIQLKHRAVYSDTGQVIEHLPSDPTPMVVRERDACYPDDWEEQYESIEDAMHCATICTDCIHDWAMDWYIDLPTTLPPNFSE